MQGQKFQYEYFIEFWVSRKYIRQLYGWNRYFVVILDKGVD